MPTTFQTRASLLGFEPGRGEITASRRYVEYAAPCEGFVAMRMLDSYDLDASFDSPSARMPRLMLDELLPAARMLVHFSALDRG